MAVAAGADDVDGTGRCFDPHHARAHHLGSAGDLVHRLAAHAQRHQEDPPICDGVASPDDHDVEGLRGPHLACVETVRDLVDEGFQISHQRALASSRKFASSAWPCSEAMLSGWNCTPWTAVLCCSPMMMPSSVRP